MKSIVKCLVAANLVLAVIPAYAAGEAKNVIFFLGDGMGPTTVTAARIYKYGEAGQLTMETLNRTARIKTFSLDAQTTDSAPSMAAYMTGVKMNNEVISMSSDTSAYNTSTATPTPYVSGSDTTCPATGNGTPAVTLLELAKTAGKSVGAVTTTRITHATPAATFAHICHRDGENRIAEQMTPGHANYNKALGDGVDVLLGGGWRHFVPSTASGSKRTDATDLTAMFTTAGYSYVNSGTAFNAVNPTTTNKLIGLFNKDHLNYELDRVKPSPVVDEPSLADMTEKALKILSKNSKGYFLMVEGGRIDHALHGTNAKRALEDTIAFDDAIKRALSLADANTLIVVTADHDHTMAFNGYSHKGNPILGLTSDIVKTTVARKANPAAAAVNATAADQMPYTTLVFGNGGNVRQRTDLTLVDTKADNYNQDVGVQLAGGVGSETHGGGDVMLFSKGPGNAGLKGTMENIKVFGFVKTAMGL